MEPGLTERAKQLLQEKNQSLDEILGSDIGSSSRLIYGQPNGAEKNDGRGSGEEKEQSSPPLKKKRIHRHIQAQLQRLEAFFEKSPYPEDKQKKELAHELGLDPQQIRFWFRNKHAQLKTKREKNESKTLREENARLRLENTTLKKAVRIVFCSACTGSTPDGGSLFGLQQMVMENYQLEEQEITGLRDSIKEDNCLRKLNMRSIRNFNYSVCP